MALIGIILALYFIQFFTSVILILTDDDMFPDRETALYYLIIPLYPIVHLGKALYRNWLKLPSRK